MTSNKKPHEKGSIAVIALILLPLCLGLSLMLLYMGELYLVRMNLDRALDDAALAGAEELDQTATSFNRSVTVITTVLNHSHVTTPIDLSQITILFGSCPHLASNLDGGINNSQSTCLFYNAQQASTNPQGLIYVAIDSGLQAGSPLIQLLNNQISINQSVPIHSQAIAGWVSPFSARLSQ